MVYHKKIYEIISLFRDFCEESIEGQIEALYLRGSYPRGDWVFGLSDLDFYIIVKDHVLHKKTLKTNFEKNVNLFLNNLRETSPELRITLAYDCKMKVLSEKCKSYITGQDSKLLFGEDVFRNVTKPDIDEIKRYGEKMVIYLCDYWEGSENIVKKPIMRIDKVRFIQYIIFKIAQNALFAKGILKFKKREIAQKFKEKYHDFPLKNLVEEAYNIRSKPSIINRNTNRLEKFLKQGIYFPSLYKKYFLNRQKSSSF